MLKPRSRSISASKLHLDIQELAEQFILSSNKETKNTLLQEILDLMKPIEIKITSGTVGPYHEDVLQDYRIRVYQCLCNYNLDKRCLFVTYCLRQLRNYLHKMLQGYTAGGIASGFEVWHQNLNISLEPYEPFQDWDDEHSKSYDIRPDFSDNTNTSMDAKQVLDKIRLDPILDLVIQQLDNGHSLLQATKLLGLNYNEIKYKINKIKAEQIISKTNV